MNHFSEKVAFIWSVADLLRGPYKPAQYGRVILPADAAPGSGFIRVGELSRRETAELIVGYSFDLTTNELAPKKIPNPGAGREHRFSAWRVAGSPTDAVTMRSPEQQKTEASDSDDDDADA
jgi:hypothetical protein